MSLIITSTTESKNPIPCLHRDDVDPERAGRQLDLLSMFRRSCKMPERRVSFREDLVSEVTVIERPDKREIQDLYYHTSDFRRFRCEYRLEDLAQANGEKDASATSKTRQRKLYQAPSTTLYRSTRRRRRSATKV